MNRTALTSLVLSLTFSLAIAQAPTGLNATAYRTTAHLRWDGYTAFQPAGYNIYRSTVSNSYGPPARRVGAYDDYTDYGIEPATTYFYKIAAFDAAGNESLLSQEIPVVTDGNNNLYNKVASLDVLIPIYTGGMSASAPDEIKTSLEHSRQFYFRNTFGQLNLNFHYMVIPGYPPFNNNGQADFGTIEADLKAKGILDNQYDAVFVEAMQLYGFFGGAWWFGQTAGGMGYDWTHYHPTNHYTQGNSWLFSHEFGHCLDMVIAHGSGYPEMLFNHFGDNYPLSPEIGVFDAGTGYDGQAQILRIFQNHLNYKAPWDGYFEVVDSDSDGLADNDPRIPMDEFRFGSNPFSEDTDSDGLTDLAEYHAGTFSSADPNHPDTDGDGLPDGDDPYPVSNFASQIVKTTAQVTIDGSMAPAEGWQHLVSNPFFTTLPGATLQVFATWDDLHFYYTFQSNHELKYFLQMDGTGEDGVHATNIRFPTGDYTTHGPNSFGDSYYDRDELVIRSDGSQVYLKNEPVPGSQVATTFSGGIYTTEVRLPHNIGPGAGWVYTPPGTPVVAVQTYSEGDIIGLDVTAIPLSQADGNKAADWFGYGNTKDVILMNDFLHFYDTKLVSASGPDYCASTSNFPWEDWIAKVKVGTLDNASAKSQYSDFSNLSTNLSTGATPIELTTGFSYFTWNEHWRVWIDLNQDGDFDDAGELVFQGIKNAPPAGTPTATLTGNLNIPASALTGPTRMRVSMKRGAYATACESLPFGEVEDYTVNITGSGPSCNITFATGNVQCQDNGTPDNPDDDTFSFEILVTGTGISQNWQMTWPGGSASGLFSVVKTIGPLPISAFAGGLNFTVFDNADPSCSATGSLTPPPPCSTGPSVCGFTENYPAGPLMTTGGFFAQEAPGGFFAVGSSPMVPTGLTFVEVTTDINGSQTSQVMKPFSAAQSTPPIWLRDGNVLFVNSFQGQITITKQSGSGLIWGNAFTIPGAVTFSIGKTVETPAGDLVVMGLSFETSPPQLATTKLFALKINSLGQQQSLTLSLPAGLQNLPTSILQLKAGPTGDFYFLLSTSAEEKYVGKLSADGALQWTSFLGGLFTSARQVEPGTDGSVLVSFTQTGGGGPTYTSVGWTKFDANGVTQWGKSGETLSGLTSNPLFLPYSNPIAAALPGGGYTVSFMAPPVNSPAGFYLVGLSPTGNVLWSKKYTTDDLGTFPVAGFMKRTNDGGYLLTGSQDNNLWLMKTDDLGNICTTQPPADYCTSSSDFPWEDWIAKVKLGSIDNASGKSQYSDFTNLGTNLSTGATPIELTAGFSYFTWDEYWRVWIDLNQDGDFDDPGELVFQGVKNAPPAGTPTATLTGNLNIPASAQPGATRMRVSMKRGAYATACETLPFGEVEDYTVHILPATGCNPDVTPPVITGCPSDIFLTVPSPGAVIWTPPTATDNCGTPALTSTHQPGSSFDFGTTTVTYSATDGANNTATCTFNVTLTQTAPNLPDLVLGNLQAPGSGAAGSAVNFTFLLDNIGTAPAAGNFTIGCYLSTDNAWSADDLLAGTVPTGNIPVNFNTTVPAAIIIPAGFAPGNYFLICVADNGDVIQESDEGNNTVSAAFQVTGGGPMTYCNASSNFPWEDWIAGVKIGTQENNSGKSTYSDFTQTFNFNLFETNPVTLTAGFSYFHHDEYWRIWIDLNGDGDFDDPGELVFSQVMNKGMDGTPTKSLTGNFNLPASAVAGTTRMRVMMKRGAFGEPCDIIPFGEIEDYSVNISGQATCRQDVGPGGFACFEEAPTPGQYYLYAYNQGMQVRYTVNKDGDVLDQLSTPIVLEDSIIVQNNTVVRKLANGTIVYQKPIAASVLNQFPNIEAAVELDDGTFMLGGIQRQYSQQGNLEADSLVIIKTDNALNFVAYERLFTNSNNLTQNKLLGFVKTSTGDAVAVYRIANTYFTTVFTYSFVKFSPQLQQLASAGINLNSLNSWSKSLCGNYRISYNYYFPSIKSTVSGTSHILYDFETMTIQTSRSSETGSVSYSGNYDSESYGSSLFGKSLSASYSIWYFQQVINPFSVKMQRSDGTQFVKRPPMQADYSHIIQTGDTTILILGSTGGQVWAYNPDCNSPGAVQPDITMSNLTLQNPNTSPGAVVWFNFDLKNIGNTTATGDYIIAAYLSNDTQLSNDDRVAGYINTGNTPVGTIPGVLGGITVPAEQNTGSYYLILRADVSNAVLELDETNNVLASATPIIIAPGSTELCGFEAPVTSDGYATFGAAALNGSHVFKMSKYDSGADVTAFRYQTFDSDGNLAETENFTLDDKPVLLADDNFLRVIAGGGNLFFLKKINKAGTVLWVKQLTIPGADNLGEVSIGEAVNGDILLTGVSTLTQSPTITYNRVWYLRLDFNGNKLTQNNFLLSYNNEPTLTSRIFNGTTQGTYLVVERATNFSNLKQPLLIKISPQTGNVEWTKDFGLFVQIRGIAETPDGATLVTTFYPNPTGGGVGTAAKLHKINADGNEVLQKDLTELTPAIPPAAQIGPPSEVSPIMRGTDGGYITGFTRQFFGATTLPPQSVIIRLDANLDSLWTRTFTGSDEGLFKTFRAVPGGAFLGARDFGASQVKLIKIGSNGQLSPCTAPGTYCQSQSEIPWEDWIARVQVSTLDNSSGKSTYSDFTALSTTLQQGSDYALTLTTGFSYFTWDEHWKVWIDYNHDGIFQEPDELVLYQVLTAPPPGTATASVTGTFKLPNTALPGPTRMRVSMKRGTGASPCETLPFGEVEDYTVVIVNSLTGGTGDRASNLGFEAVRERTWVNLYGAFHFEEAVSAIEFEKSPDGQQYELLAVVDGKQQAGASQVARTMDTQPNDGFNFYRMLILLENGEEVYSPVRIVSFDMPVDFTLFPNPASTGLFVHLPEPPETDMQWNINDAYGRVRWSQKIAAGTPFPYRLDVQGLEPGMYYLLVMRPGKRTVARRFVVAR